MRIHPHLQRVGRILKGKLPGRERRPDCSPRRSTSFRPEIEILEPRRLPTTFFVSVSDRDDGSPETLRWAIDQANNYPDPSAFIQIAFSFGFSVCTIQVWG